MHWCRAPLGGPRRGSAALSVSLVTDSGRRIRHRSDDRRPVLLPVPAARSGPKRGTPVRPGRARHRVAPRDMAELDELLEQIVEVALGYTAGSGDGLHGRVACCEREQHRGLFDLSTLSVIALFDGTASTLFD